MDDLRYAATLANAIDAALDANPNDKRAAASRAWLNAVTGDEDLDTVRAEMIRRIDQLAK